MNELLENDFEVLDDCPWCATENEKNTILYTDYLSCPIYKCAGCGTVYAKKRLNKSGLNKYWSKYFSQVQTHNKELTKKREKMYKIDFDFVQQYISGGKVLDVGCGNGDFMKFFEESGFDSYGIEFGKEAAEIACKNHKVIQGEFSNLQINDKYNVIIFRGVLQYIPNPISYLEKAISLLEKNGIIFITAQPNMNSLCFKLFKDSFTQPVTGSDFIGYTEKIFTEFFKKNKMEKIGEKYFYEETPYANIENDILKVAKAIEIKRRNEKITFNAPAFYENMMTLLYKKVTKS